MFFVGFRGFSRVFRVFVMGQNRFGTFLEWLSPPCSLVEGLMAIFCLVLIDSNRQTPYCTLGEFVFSKNSKSSIKICKKVHLGSRLPKIMFLSISHSFFFYYTV